MPEPRANNHSYLFWSSLALTTGAYLCLKLLSTPFIAGLFERSAWNILNALASSDANRSLSFYLGAIGDRWIGPAQTLLAAVAFMLLGWRYFRDSSTGVFALWVFVFLALTKWEVLSFPVWGDPISGPWAEAIWLARHDFDYAALFREAEYARGGPKVYFFSIYPTFLAVLIKLIPSTKVFLAVSHLIVFAMAAWTVSLFRDLLLKISSPATAFLGSAFLLFLPVFQAQSELLNMEMPCLLFFMLAARFLVQRRLKWAAVMAVLSSLVKATGVIACATVSVTGIALFCFDQNRRRVATLIWSLVPAVLALGLVYLKGLINEKPLPHNAMGFLIGWPNMKNLTFITPLLAVCAAFIAFSFLFSLKRKNGTAAYYAVGVMISGALFWFLLYLNFAVMGPRYKLLVAPFLLFCVLFCFTRLVSFEKLQRLFMVLAVLLAAAGSHGLWYPERIESDYYAYTLMDRSLEYRNDMSLHLKVAERLSEDFPGFTVGAPFVTAQALALPELGYAEEPLPVVLYGMPITYGGIKNFTGLNDLDIRKTVWIGFNAPKREGFAYPIDPQDKVLTAVESGNKKATLFMGGIAVERMRVLVGLYQAGLLGAN